MEKCNNLAKKHEIETTGLAMKLCVVQLVHKVKLDLENKGHFHKMRLDVVLEGKQEQIDLIKWQIADLTDDSNKWKTKIQAKKTD